MRRRCPARIGGYDGVVSFVGLVFPRVVEHPDLTQMFARGHGKDSQQRQFQMVVELICQRSGGPCAYTGRPMPQVHDGLGITDAQWTTFMAIIERGLDEKKYPANVRAPFLQIWSDFRSGVVQKSVYDHGGNAEHAEGAETFLESLPLRARRSLRSIRDAP